MAAPGSTQVAGGLVWRHVCRLLQPQSPQSYVDYTAADTHCNSPLNDGRPESPCSPREGATCATFQTYCLGAAQQKEEQSFVMEVRDKMLFVTFEDDLRRAPAPCTTLRTSGAKTREPAHNWVQQTNPHLYYTFMNSIIRTIMHGILCEVHIRGHCAETWFCRTEGVSGRHLTLPIFGRPHSTRVEENVRTYRSWGR